MTFENLSIFALFPEQLLNGLVSWGSPGNYSMIDCSLGDALRALSYQFWSTVPPFGARLRSHIGTLMRLLAAKPLSIALHLFPGQCLCGTILVTLCSMVWDWRVSRAGPMPFYWPSCSLTFCLLLFSLSFLSFYGLVLWGLGLRTDRVLIALSQPCIANLF